MNPNYLLKDELQYELLVTGIKSEADVQTLRKLFRLVFSENVRVELTGLGILKVQELYQTVV
jgi:hypothetical protein